MIFKQHEDGSADIEFSWKERCILFKKGKLHLSDENLRHFGNHLIKIVSTWQVRFKKDIADKQTFIDTEVKGE